MESLQHLAFVAVWRPDWSTTRSCGSLTPQRSGRVWISPSSPQSIWAWGPTGGHQPGRHDRRRPRPSHRCAHRQAGRPATTHPNPGRRVLAPAPAHHQPVRYRWRRAEAAHRRPGRRALASPGTPADSCGRAGRPAWLADRVADRADRHAGAGRRARRHASKPASPTSPDRLTPPRSATRWGCRTHPAAPSPCQQPWRRRSRPTCRRHALEEWPTHWPLHGSLASATLKYPQRAPVG